jgi:hypothetical protein
MVSLADNRRTGSPEASADLRNFNQLTQFRDTEIPAPSGPLALRTRDA